MRLQAAPRQTPPPPHHHHPVVLLPHSSLIFKMEKWQRAEVFISSSRGWRERRFSPPHPNHLKRANEQNSNTRRRRLGVCTPAAVVVWRRSTCSRLPAAGTSARRSRTTVFPTLCVCLCVLKYCFMFLAMDPPIRVTCKHAQTLERCFKVDSSSSSSSSEQRQQISGFSTLSFFSVCFW